MSITIEGELYSTKNHTQIFRRGDGSPFVTKNTKAKKQEADFAWQLRAQRRAWDKLIKGLDHPLCIEFKIFRQTKRRFDYTNIVQGLCDAMTKEGYLPDDSANYLIPYFAPYEVDKARPRVEIRVLPIQPGAPLYKI